MKWIMPIAALLLSISSFIHAPALATADSVSGPDDGPTIADMMKYDKWDDPVVPSPTIPESEMTTFVFSKDWVLANDRDPSPRSVDVSFPKSRQSQPMVMSERAETVELRLPTRLVDSFNTSRNPDNIRLNVPTEWLAGLPTPPPAPVSEWFAETVQRSNEPPPVSNPGDSYYDYVSIENTSGNTVTRARGYITATSFENPGGEEFQAYLESELEWFNHSVPAPVGPHMGTVEMVLDWDEENDPFVFVAIYDQVADDSPDKEWANDKNWLNMDVDPGQRVYFICELSGNGYDCYLRDPDTGAWSSRLWQDNHSPYPATLDQIDHTSELTDHSGFTGWFEAVADPISTYDVYYNGAWRNTNTAFAHRATKTSDPYVEIQGGFDMWGGFTSIHRAFGEGVELDVVVELQGSGRPEPEGWEVPLTVRLFNPGADVLNDSPIQEFNVTTSKLSTVAVGECGMVSPGTYDITAVSEHTLLNVRRSVTITTDTAVDMGTLLEGNADGNNVIDMWDFSIFSSALNTHEGDAGYDPRADFDRNGTVDMWDFSLLSSNLNVTGPREI